MNTNNTASSTNTSSNTPRRGVKKPEAMAIVSKFSFPASPFTIKDAINATGINHWYVSEYVKKNGTVVGDAPKTKGSRGPAAKLYQISK